MRCEHLILTTVLPCLVSCVLYHLAQLNFLHFMSIFANFWNFSHSHFKKYFPIISGLLMFGIMIQPWPWPHEFFPFYKDFSVFLLAYLVFPKMEISINCVALVSGFLNVVIWQYLVLISLRYSHIDFQGQISKKGNHNVMCTLWSSGRVSKNGNSTLWPCHFGKCLLTVGGDE